jgi:hypothetical protein
MRGGQGDLCPAGLLIEIPFDAVPIQIFVIKAKKRLCFLDGSNVIHGVQTHRVFLAEVIVVFEKKRLVLFLQDHGGF